MSQESLDRVFDEFTDIAEGENNKVVICAAINLLAAIYSEASPEHQPEMRSDLESWFHLALDRVDGSGASDRPQRLN